MNANELRIGNYVNLDAPIQDKLIRIAPYHILEIYQCEIAKSKIPYKPIPLTEEILLKCEGFSLTSDYGDQKYYDNGKFGVCFDHDELVFFRCSIRNAVNNLIYDSEHFQYLHHFQNTMYSLTGEELKIEL
ncbi:hypothetical protein QO206_13440 [Leeuwenhoekiella aequorea]|uniref:hypothetical protein n=1 Tax=Leeuwenhoekiella aequorea TaxID=283736 RepID=UPI00352E1B6A|tara:strand:+ start:4904 stop:5296 length:393 start_codon:yes stop_codon:yes gene_type:complete